MRLLWSDDALADLESIAERAPRTAGHLFEQVNWLARRPFPGMFRQVVGRPDEHVLSVPPYAVFYAVSGDALTVLTIKDSRRLKKPWGSA